MTSRFEKWAFGLTFAVFFLTMVAVLVAVGYATVHLVTETPSKTDIHNEIESAKIEIISAIREEIHETKNEVHNLRSETNSKIITHITDLHATK